MRKPFSSASSSREEAEEGAGRSKAATTTTTTTPCCSKVGLKRGPWTPEEDEVLSKFIEKEGEGRWRTLPKRAGLLRCGKSCRLRWMNYLRPSVKRGHIAPDEEDLILRLHRLLGNRWSLIAGRIPGRTDNEIKNYWNTHLSKKLISQGIDPRTHKPLLSTTAAAASNNSKSTKFSTSTPIQQHQHALNNNNNSPLQYPYHHQLHTTPPDDEALVEPAGYGNGIIIPFPADNTNDDDEQVEEEQEDMNYCSDDVFSSFLNSLINEDAFSHSHPHSPNNNINVIIPPLPLPLPWETTSPPSSTHHNTNIHPS